MPPPSWGPGARLAPRGEHLSCPFAWHAFAGHKHAHAGRVGSSHIPPAPTPAAPPLFLPCRSRLCGHLQSNTVDCQALFALLFALRMRLSCPLPRRPALLCSARPGLVARPSLLPLLMIIRSIRPCPPSHAAPTVSIYPVRSSHMYTTTTVQPSVPGRVSFSRAASSSAADPLRSDKRRVGREASVGKRQDDWGTE